MISYALFFLLQFLGSYASLEPNFESDDYYEILGVSKEATNEDIKTVYRVLSKKWHPDKNEGTTGEIFKKISVAYGTLSDPDKREFYDLDFGGDIVKNNKQFSENLDFFKKCQLGLPDIENKRLNDIVFKKLILPFQLPKGPNDFYVAYKNHQSNRDKIILSEIEHIWHVKNMGYLDANVSFKKNNFLGLGSRFGENFSTAPINFISNEDVLNPKEGYYFEPSDGLLLVVSNTKSNQMVILYFLKKILMYAFVSNEIRENKEDNYGYEMALRISQGKQSFNYSKYKILNDYGIAEIFNPSGILEKIKSKSMDSGYDFPFEHLFEKNDLESAVKILKNFIIRQGELESLSIQEKIFKKMVEKFGPGRTLLFLGLSAIGIVNVIYNLIYAMMHKNSSKQINPELWAKLYIQGIRSWKSRFSK